ncbi:MAG: hypothetical protein WCK58_12140 [Chloroflexota bacterium]
MHRLLILSGVLGGGSAVVFALAALAFTLFPTGALLPGGSGMNMMSRNLVAPGFNAAGAMPAVITTTGGATIDVAPIAVPAPVAIPDPSVLP